MFPHRVTTWQLRTHYLATIRDGVGDRLLNVNSSLLNSHTYRAAGWGDVTSANANNIRRAYSPPIPTAALASGYFQAINRSNVRDDDGSVQRPSGMQLGIPEDDEDNASDLMAGGRRSPSIVDFRRRHGLDQKHGRRTRGQRSETPLGARQDDSSDLSDDSDDSERYGARLESDMSSRTLCFTDILVVLCSSSSLRRCLCGLVLVHPLSGAQTAALAPKLPSPLHP